MASWYYQHTGYLVASEMELPEWSRFGKPNIRCEPDIVIRLHGCEAVPAGSDVRFVNCDECCFVVRNTGYYRVTRNGAIDIFTLPDADQAIVRAVLIAYAWGALLHLRGDLPLHGGVVQVRDVAVAFCGESGAGKSSMAARMTALGYPLISDDLSRVDVSTPHPNPLLGKEREQEDFTPLPQPLSTAAKADDEDFIPDRERVAPTSSPSRLGRSWREARYPSRGPTEERAGVGSASGEGNDSLPFSEATRVGSYPYVYRSAVRLKLWRDAIANLDLTDSILGQDDARFDKYHIRLANEPDGDRFPLAAIFILGWGDLSLTRLTGTTALRRLIAAATYRGGLIEPMGRLADYWSSCTEVARRVAVWELTRPRDWSKMDAAVALALSVINSKK